MRGQYRIVVPLVQVPTTVTDILGFIVPANYVLDIVALEVYPVAAMTASNPVQVQFRRITTGTPTLSNTGSANGITVVATDAGNAIASAMASAVGARGAAGTGNVWSTAPGAGDLADMIDFGAFEGFGGRLVKDATLQKVIARIGGTSEQRWTMRAVAATALNCAIALTINE